MKAKEQWISDTMDSLDGIDRAKVSAALAGNLEAMANMTGTGASSLHIRRYWPAAAALALLLAMNILVFTSYHRSSGQHREPVEILVDEYLSYLGPIKL